MNESTTTESTTQNLSSDDLSQLASGLMDEAEVSANEPQPAPTGEDVAAPVDAKEEAPAPAEAPTESAHAEWFRSKGVDPSDPHALDKVAEMYQNAERAMHEARREAKNLQQTAADVTGETEAPASTNEDVRYLQNRLTEMEFFQDNPEAREQRDAIAQKFQEYPELAYSFNLKAAYNLVKADRLDVQVKEAEARGREAAKADMARTSAATMPKGQAAGPSEAPESDALLDAFMSA